MGQSICIPRRQSVHRLEAHMAVSDVTMTASVLTVGVILLGCGCRVLKVADAYISLHVIVSHL